MTPNEFAVVRPSAAKRTVDASWPRARRLASSITLLFALWLGACDGAASGEGTASPTRGGGPGLDERPSGIQEGASAAELDARKDELVRKLAEQRTAASSTPTACEDVCSIASEICAIGGRLCSIADDHAGEDDYQQLCREAKRECKDASDACSACVDRHAN
jgi:hypothetical protein